MRKKGYLAVRVLVVHDREPVAKRIGEIVAQTIGAKGILSYAVDGVSAHKKLSSEIYDLMIMDLTLPHITGKGSADYTTADRLLQELFAADTLLPPGDVIGITKDEKALKLVSSQVAPHLMATIIEDGDDSWEGALKDKVVYANRASETRLLSINSHFWYDALIVTALDEEFLPFEKSFEFEASRAFDGAKDFAFYDGKGSLRRGVAYSIGRSGQASAASATQSLLSFFRPSVALMSGFCGGINPKKVNLGDLIAFETVFDWDYGKWSEEEGSDRSVFWSRPNPVGVIDTDLHRIVRTYAVKGLGVQAELTKELSNKAKGAVAGFTTYVAPSASGSAVVANDDIIGKIRGINEGIKAVDMESYGFYQACERSHVRKPRFLCVKAVADYCNGSKGDEYHGSCSQISAAAVVQMLTKDIEF